MEKTSREYLHPILDAIVDKHPSKGVQLSQPLTFLPNLGLPEQMLLLSLQQDFQTINIKCTFDYVTNADC